MFVFVSSRRRHTRCALVTGVQTCALPISFQKPVGTAFQSGNRSAHAPSAAGHRPEQLQWLVEPFPAKLPAPGFLLHPGTSPSPDKAGRRKIGRATCRERVGRNVLFWVVALALNNTKNIVSSSRSDT